jgi:Zn-dependent protease
MWRFRLFGFPVTIQWIFWVVGLMLGAGTLTIGGPEGMQLTLTWMVVFFVSILWHELGHAFAFRHYGQRPEIVLYGMGGYARGSAPLTRKQDIVVSLAGPAAGFSLGLAVLLLAKYIPGFTGSMVMKFFVIQMLWVNFIWSAVNLLPILPLDGGRVCAAVVAGGRNRSAGLVPKIGLVTAAIAAAVFLSMQLFFAGALFAFLAYQNWQMLQNVQGRPGGGSPFGGGGGGGPFGGPR